MSLQLLSADNILFWITSSLFLLLMGVMLVFKIFNLISIVAEYENLNTY